MKATEGRPGRVFVIRLEAGDEVPGCIEQFALEKGVLTGQVVLIGGVASGEVVVGPRRSAEMPPEPMRLPLDGAHEIAGIGVLAPNAAGRPVLHIHAALGRAGQTMTGCLRLGVGIWLTGEAIIYEITGANAVRTRDQNSGFELLVIGDSASTTPQ